MYAGTEEEEREEEEQKEKEEQNENEEKGNSPLSSFPRWKLRPLLGGVVVPEDKALLPVPA